MPSSSDNYLIAIFIKFFILGLPMINSMNFSSMANLFGGDYLDFAIVFVVMLSREAFLKLSSILKFNT